MRDKTIFKVIKCFSSLQSQVNSLKGQVNNPAWIENFFKYSIKIEDNLWWETANSGFKSNRLQKAISEKMVLSQDLLKFLFLHRPEINMVISPMKLGNTKYTPIFLIRGLEPFFSHDKQDILKEIFKAFTKL